MVMVMVTATRHLALDVGLDNQQNGSGECCSFTPCLQRAVAFVTEGELHRDLRVVHGGVTVPLQ